MVSVVGVTTDLSPVKLLYDSSLCVIPFPPQKKSTKDLWKQYQEQRPTWEATVNLYQEAEKKYFPDMAKTGFALNTAIVCGKSSDNFFCVEYDDETACVYSFLRFPELKLNETRTVKSGGKSIHLYFKAPPGADLKSKSYHRDGVPAEFRGNGNIIIAPPSVHPSGRAYIFKNRREIAVKSPDELKAMLAQLAQEWRFVSKVVPKWEKGSRDLLTMGFSCFMRKKLGYDQGRVESVIAAICGVCLDEEKDSRLAQVRREFTLGEDETSMQHLGEDLVEDLAALAPRRRGQRRAPRAQDPYEEPNTMADEIMKEHRFVTTMDTEELYVYNDGIYHDCGEVVVKERTIQIDPEKSSRYAEEVIFHIKAKTYTHRDKFNADPNLIPLENGVFNLETATLQELSPDYIYTMTLQVKYDQSADCPAFKKFISEVLHPGDIGVIQELFGFCLLRDYRYQKAFMFVGDGANGKSTLLETLRCFLGWDNVASVPLQDLTLNRFASSRLYGKLANIFADLPDKALVQTGRFKTLTGGDSIDAEKKFHDGFSFTNYAKLIFSCNKMPKVEGDDSSAFYRRWVILNFPNAFLGDKADKSLIYKLTTPEELSGVFNWAIEGLKRLRGQDDFTYSKSVEEVREQYDRLSDPLRAFVADKVVADDTGVMTKEEFYAAYVEYCKGNNLPIATKTALGHELPAVITTVRADDRAMVKGKRHRAWRGIKLRGMDDTLDKGEYATEPKEKEYFKEDEI